MAVSPAVLAVETALKVLLTTGGSETYVLAQKPTVRFDGTRMLVETPTVNAGYQRSEVKSMTFVSVDAGVDDVKADGVVYVYKDNVFECADHDIRVFDMSGRQAAAGHGSVSLAGCTSGVYVVNVNGKSIKVVKQ